MPSLRKSIGDCWAKHFLADLSPFALTQWYVKKRKLSHLLVQRFLCHC